MGILTGKDIFTSKYTTAIITDAEDRGFFVPIKYMLDNFFMVLLNKNYYAFSMENARIITHRVFMLRTFKWVHFDTSHVYSVKHDKLKGLEKVLLKNQLPKMNMLQFAMFKILGRKEKLRIRREADTIKSRAALAFDQGEEPEFEPHDLNKLIEEIADRQKEFPQEAENLINYIKSLDTDYIVTPVRKTAEFIEDDLITTKASFLGELGPRLSRLDNKHKEITNTPYSTKNAYVMKIMVLSMIVVGGLMIWWMVDQGYFDFIGDLIPDTSTFSSVSLAPPVPRAADPCSDESLQNKYTPIELKIAIEQGTETCKLSPTMQKLVDGVDLPKAEPKQ